jgi:hypothetical protein
MRRIVPALLLVLAVPVAAAAQSPPARTPGQVPIEIRRDEAPPEGKPGRVIVPPSPLDPATVEDARRAAAEAEQSRRDQEFIREQTLQPPRRPDLGYDVTGGIQRRNLQRSPGR